MLDLQRDPVGNVLMPELLERLENIANGASALQKVCDIVAQIFVHQIWGVAILSSKARPHVDMTLRSVGQQLGKRPSQ